MNIRCETGREPDCIQEKRIPIFFFSREEVRVHVHVVPGDGEAKFWLEPAIELVRNHRYATHQLTEIESIVEEPNDALVAA